MDYLLARIRLSWGFAARLQPQSKMRLALKYPPPTTLIGALAYPFIRSKDNRVEVLQRNKRTISAADSIRGKFIDVAASFSEEPLIYGDYLRIHRFYKGRVDKAITAFPVSLSYSSGKGIADIAYITEKADKDLERAAWGITRLGSRESVVSTEFVYVGRAEEKVGNEVTTRFSFQLNSAIRIVRGSSSVIYAVNWRSAEIGSYEGVERIPYFYPRGKVTVKGDLKWFELELPWGREVVIHS